MTRIDPRQLSAAIVAAQGGDSEANDRLVAVYLFPLARGIVATLNNVPSTIDYDDLVAIAVSTMWQKVGRVNAARNAHAYLTQVALNAMRKWIRREAHGELSYLEDLRVEFDDP